jgi:hypothetical protein
MKLFYRLIKKTGLFLILITACTFVHGQIPVKGKVISAEDNQGMPGVYILIKGTEQGIVSGPDGTYNITVRSAEDVLVFRFIGYISQEIAVKNKTTIDVILVSEITALQSVVVMGYSTKKRNEITSAVTTLSSDKLMDVTANDVGTMLQGESLRHTGHQQFRRSGSKF